MNMGIGMGRMMEDISAWGTSNETEWVGPISNMILSIKETPDTTLYRILHAEENESSHNHMTEFLTDYFQLNTELVPLYKSWSQNDDRLSIIATVIPGLRIIRQDPVECLFSFICSSNNNIPRITKMLSSFREAYGEKMLDLPMRMLDCDGDGVRVGMEVMDVPMSIYSFPTLEELSTYVCYCAICMHLSSFIGCMHASSFLCYLHLNIQYSAMHYIALADSLTHTFHPSSTRINSLSTLERSTEKELRDMGLGYRAKFIIETRDMLIGKFVLRHLFVGSYI